MQLDSVISPHFLMSRMVLNHLVQQVFGFYFNFAAAAGRLTQTYTVDGLWMHTAEWPRRATLLRSGGYTRNVNLLLNVAALDGHLEFGRYTIGEQDGIQHTYLVHHRDLNRFIKRRFKLDFDFVMNLGLKQSPGTRVDYQITGALDDTARQICAGHPVRRVGPLLNAAAHTGSIPRGHYIITTDKEPPAIDHYRRLLKQVGDPAAPVCVRYRNRFPGCHAFREIDRNFA